MTPTNCATGTLAPYAPTSDMPWDERRVMHLYRRLGFGATPAELDSGLNQHPSALVDALLDQAMALPLPPEPEWSNWPISRYTNEEEAVLQIFAWRRRWVSDMLAHGPREKLALFWHNHFVTRLEGYGCPSYMYQYHKVLQQNVLGNFREFLKAIGTTPAMLVFLNGVQNTRFNPNENYARELYELFTLGRDNGYTQQDIVQTARALTGWNALTEYCGPISFFPLTFDPGQKTIFGRTGNWDYNGVHELLFAQRGALIANYICRKIYRTFVSPQIDEAIVNELASIFIQHDFEIAPVLRTLFKSDHFFSDANIGVLVKSPLELLITFLREGGFEIDWRDEWLDGLIYLASELGQELFNPIDVAGWQGDRLWVNNNTLTGRWQALRFVLFTVFQNYPQQLRHLARVRSENSNDADYIAEVLTDHFLPNGLQTADEYDWATLAFKSEIPDHYFRDGSWNLDWETVPIQVALLIDHLIRRPEFQLM
ncbi:MAG TPA: DUF1800 domain-containing protein [Saprospiraceae bacterium]|nr:DUF1800 domain-containing protein [Saprospiraceae bacterium]HMP13365.1 DUF1800 domain-containing protein [Saprospiraceae bacterium]